MTFKRHFNKEILFRLQTLVICLTYTLILNVLYVPEILQYCSISVVEMLVQFYSLKKSDMTSNKSALMVYCDKTATLNLKIFKLLSWIR